MNAPLKGASNLAFVRTYRSLHYLHSARASPEFPMGRMTSPENANHVSEVESIYQDRNVLSSEIGRALGNCACYEAVLYRSQAR